MEWQKDLLELCEPRILAYDIECEKAPLKFPSAERDRIYMISYMCKDGGYLLINRGMTNVLHSPYTIFYYTEHTPPPTVPINNICTKCFCTNLHQLVYCVCFLLMRRWWKSSMVLGVCICYLPVLS
ncbi:hypothetical protein EON63_03700 [archaeon]|nr:MAG: hypothetical protein EON63_03700 [archaeon]